MNRAERRAQRAVIWMGILMAIAFSSIPFTAGWFLFHQPEIFAALGLI